MRLLLLTLNLFCIANFSSTKKNTRRMTHTHTHFGFPSNWPRFSFVHQDFAFLLHQDVVHVTTQTMPPRSVFSVDRISLHANFRMCALHCGMSVSVSVLNGLVKLAHSSATRKEFDCIRCARHRYIAVGIMQNYLLF